MSLKSLVTEGGTTKQIPDGQKLLVGDGIDASNAVAPSTLSIGTDALRTNAITIGQTSVTTTFPGDIDVQGNVNTVGGTTFTQDVTFGDANTDTVTFVAEVDSDIAFKTPGYRVTNMVDPLLATDGATKAYADLKLALTGGTMSGAINMGSQQITNLANGTASTDAINLSQLNAVAAIEYDQQIFVSDGADPSVATGAPLRPFASISAAMAAITDASPTKRYAISVAAGEYTEASALNLKPNVFIIGVNRDAVRITAPSYALDASFTGGADNRSGISNAIVTGAASFNFTTVTSTAGKLYFRDTSFVSAVTLTGYNNAIVQAQFSGCQMFGVFTVQGVNVAVFNDNILFSNIVLTQSPFGGVPTILTATGGSCSGTVTATTTVNDFNRRISVFARSFWMNGAVTVDGPSSYLDYTVDSLPSGGASTPNGGNLVSIDYGANKALSNLVYPTAVNNPIIPATTNATNMGDWSKQWFFSFSYVYLSTGTELYIGSAGTSAVPDSAGRAVYLQPDQYGIDVNVNGGVLDLRTANATGTGISGNVDISTGTSVNGNSGSITLTTGTPSGTGTRGSVTVDSPKVDLTGKITKYNNVAPTDGQVLIGNTAGARFDAATLTAGSGVTITPGAGSITIAATGTGGTVTSVDVSGGTTGLTTSGGPITGSGTITLAGTLGVANGGTGTATAFTSGSVLFAGPSGVYAQDNANLFWDDTNNRLGIGVSGGSVTHTLTVGAPGSPNFQLGNDGRIYGYNGTIPTNGQILIGTGTAFDKATLTPGTNIAVTNGSGSITIGLTGQVAVANGGTGQSSLTSGALLVGNGGSAVNTLAPGSNGQVLTVVGGAWTASSLPAATDYSVVALTTAQAANTAVTVAGAAAIATSEANARVAGIVAATNSVKVLGIVTCIVEAARAGQISAGEPVYLSASEAGKVTDVAPSTATQVVAELGIATAADSSGTVTVLWQPKSIVVL